MRRPPCGRICASAQEVAGEIGPGETGAAAPKFKTIWEPVPFNKDIELNAIACVPADYTSQGMVAALAPQPGDFAACLLWGRRSFS